MALEMAPAVIHLMEVATGRTVAKLEDPHGDRATWQGFTPDGTRLVVVAGYADAIHIWDLRAIRTRLKDMNLDWDWPEFSPKPIGTPAVEAATVEAAEGRGSFAGQGRRGRISPAGDGLSKRTRTRPAQQPAWVYLTAPEPLRTSRRPDPGRGGDAPGTVERGVSQHAGPGVLPRRSLRESADVLRPNLRSQRDKELAIDLYILAMSCHRLGEAERARDVYDLAVRWSQAPRGTPAEDLEEQAEFRAEAEKLLGIGREPVRP